MPSGLFLPSRSGIRSGTRLFFHAVAFPLDDDDFGVVQQPVEDGRGECAVVVEDAGPVLEGPVRREDHGALLIAMADDLKKQIRSVLVDGQVSQFIEDQEFGFEILFRIYSGGGEIIRKRKCWNFFE